MQADTTARKAAPDKPSFEPSGHQVQFYKDDAVIVATIARFVTDALRHGRGAIVVATKAHLDAVLEKVGDVRTAIRYHQLVPVDAAVLLSRLMVDGVPNEGLFVENVVPLIVKVRAATGHNRVHFYGEMIDLLWQAGNTKAMLALEEMWEKLSSREELELMFGYCLEGFARAESRESVATILAEHRGVASNSSFVQALQGMRPDAMVLLEQRAAVLEAEIDRRTRAEAALAELYVAERAARAEAEAAHDRTAFLLEASIVLSSSLAFGENLERLAEMSVPRFADLCLVEVVSESRPVPRLIAHAHRDPAEGMRIQEHRWVNPPDLDGSLGVPNVLRTGVSELHDPVEGELRTATEFLGSNLRSLVVAPIVARQKIFGAITFASYGERRLGGVDKELAELIGRRAGIAIDNALLFAEAQRSTRAMEDVLAIVSHDLRNPLSAIRLNTASLLRVDGPQQARVQRHAAAIERSSATMSRLIADLLDYSNIQRGTLALERRTTQAAEILGAVSELCSALAAERHVELDVQTSGVTERNFEADVDRLAQALGNIVSNAINVTPSNGRVAVSARVDETEIVFVVEDAGPGLSPDELARVFDRYWRSANTNYRGTGLGLAIAKGIAEAHGGRIWGESEVGKGSRFHIAVPL
jgi:signal transduction histidine kinase